MHAPTNDVAAESMSAARREIVRPKVDNSVPLDQWRGFALVLVLISHGLYFTGRVHGIGRVGVNLFFFISGVLVFRSLARRSANSGWELAAKFWYRRLKRLFPALLTYVVAMFPAVFVLQHYFEAPEFGVAAYLKGSPYAVLYAVNYGPHGIPMSLEHLWSLSCEMQFYLLGPLIFLLGGNRPVRQATIWGGLLALLLISGLLGAILDRTGAYKYHFEVAVWPMMLGFWCEYRKDLFLRIPAAWFGPIINVGIVALLTIAVVMPFGLEMKKPVIAIGTLAFLPCFVAYLSGRPVPGFAGRILRWLGERTYSIYLWQQPFTICNYLPTALHPVGAVLATLVGGVWFHFFERPFLSTGRKRSIPG